MKKGVLNYSITWNADGGRFEEVILTKRAAIKKYISILDHCQEARLSGQQAPGISELRVWEIYTNPEKPAQRAQEGNAGEAARTTGEPPEAARRTETHGQPRKPAEGARSGQEGRAAGNPNRNTEAAEARKRGQSGTWKHTTGDPIRPGRYISEGSRTTAKHTPGRR